MTGQFSLQSKLTRRSFLKASGITAGAVGLAGVAGMTSTNGWLSPAQAHAEEAGNETVRYCTHFINCAGRCHLACTVRDGRMVKVEASERNNPLSDRYETFCARGCAEVERIYSPTRLQTPLKRVGERGSGEFVEISWDEALDEVAEQLQGAIEKYGPESVLIYGSTASTINYNYPLLPKFLGVAAYQGHSKNGIDMAMSNNITVSMGASTAYSNVEDWVNSKTVVITGKNILDTTLFDTKFFFAAQDAGAKIIAIDPRYCAISQKADQWIPINPGTDYALWMALGREIIERKLYDEDYIRKNSSVCFLVNTQDGTQLRQDPNAKDQKGAQNPFMVWDSVTNSVQPYNGEGVVGELFKEVEIDGVLYKTVLSVIKDNYQDYTFQWASDYTGIPVETMEGLLADITAGPTYFGWGLGGPDKYTNSDVLAHAMSIVAVLLNDIARKGAGFGDPNSHNPDYGAKLNSWKIPAEFKTIPLKQNAATYPLQDNPIKVFFSVGNTLLQLWANNDRARDWAKSLDFIVEVDAFHCPTVDFADIVLPAATCFEGEYDLRWYCNSRHHMQLCESVIKPLFESKTDWQIEHDLLERMGYGEYLPKTADENLEAIFDGVTDPNMEGITIESLRKNNCIMRLNVPDEPYRNAKYAKGEFDTPSGKIELYHEKMYKWNQAVPTFIPQPEIDNEEKRERYPLPIYNFHSRLKVHSSLGNSEWMRQFYEPLLEMNPIEAEARGIQQGDIVEAFNDRGAFKCKALVTEAIRPGSVAICSGWWDSQMVEGNAGKVSNDTLTDRHFDLPIGPMIPFNDTLVEIRKA